MEKKTPSAKNTEWKGRFVKAAGRSEDCFCITLQAWQFLVEVADVRRVLRGSPENPNQIQILILILTKTQKWRRAMLAALALPLELAD